MINKGLERLNNNLYIDSDYSNIFLNVLQNTEYRYPKDINVSINNAINVDHLSKKEAIIIAISSAIGNNSSILKKSLYDFSKKEIEISNDEYSEIISCVSLMSINNVIYRFKHFIKDGSYNNHPVNVKMNIMANPILGKEIFELISIVISAINSCQACIEAHENSLIKLNVSKNTIFDAIRIGAIITGLSKLYY
ncbi:MAG: carboxymuconolactone decarboxylase family protein [Bacteroides sp.]|nr:MAG: carboxymuconolactone decarboxylase family protein [Bacteroides sp.]